MLKYPDPSTYCPDTDYLRELVCNSGLSQRAAAKAIGISERKFRDYLNEKHPDKAPYPVQFALECLPASPKTL